MKHAWKSWVLCAALLMLIGFVGAILAEQVWAQAKGPENFTFAGGNEGKVTFSHEKHRAKVEKCQACHTKVFKMKKGTTGPLTMAKMKAGEQCGACHNGKTEIGGVRPASVDDTAKCETCHRK